MPGVFIPCVFFVGRVLRQVRRNGALAGVASLRCDLLVSGLLGGAATCTQILATGVDLAQVGEVVNRFEILGGTCAGAGLSHLQMLARALVPLIPRGSAVFLVREGQFEELGLQFDLLHPLEYDIAFLLYILCVRKLVGACPVCT